MLVANRAAGQTEPDPKLRRFQPAVDPRGLKDLQKEIFHIIQVSCLNKHNFLC